MSQLKEDLSSEWKLTKVYPDVKERWLRVRQIMFDETGKQIKVTEGLRTFAHQFEYYKIGRRQGENGQWYVAEPSKIVTKAKPGKSLHNYGLAVDSCFMGDDPYLIKMERTQASSLWHTFGQVVLRCGFDWGGNWKNELQDRPHAEICYNLKLSTIQAFFEENGMDGLYKKLDQYRNKDGLI